MRGGQAGFLAAMAGLLAVCPGVPAANGAEPRHDVVIYGATSGGVIAAIQAKAMGRTVMIVEPGRHVGGLSSGGLGATDIGNKAAIGGLSREFYRRIGRHYSEASAWKHEGYRGPRKGSTEPEMWTFEPHVAEQVFRAWLAEVGVEVAFDGRLELGAGGVEKDGRRIVAFTTEDGRRFGGAMFIDATYEGDLMAKAGVSYHVGREAQSVYGESLNGIRTKQARHHQFTHQVDPFVVPGDRASGLLPLVSSEPPGKDGDGDRRVQAYNFRICTTDVPANRRDWPKPEGYDEKEYELLLRNFEAGDHRVPWNPVRMPNRKTDTNNNYAISTDYIGANYEYPEADHRKREQIIAAHRRYQMGLMWTLANHARVPEAVRGHFQRLGLAKDEFVDNDNWPHQLYVREARRMVSDYVMAQDDCQWRRTADDPVGLGAYNMDSHNCQRYVTAEGLVRNEGDLQVGVKPYRIAFRSIRPRREECENLLVPVCLAASHIAYGSIRMEPVFMVLGQSAATAAALAIEAGTAVQDVDYAALRKRLLADGQVLEWAGERAANPSRLAKNLAAGKPQVVVTYGTSLTAGGAWVGQLRQTLDQRFPKLATVINSGQGSSWSKWGVDNLEPRVIEQKPDTVFIEFGINDAYLPYKISVADARRNLETMIDRILEAKPDTEIILMTMNPPTGVHLERRPKVKDYYQMYRDVAKERKVLLIDHEPNWDRILEEDKDLFSKHVPDGIHPGPSGATDVTTPAILQALGI